MTTNDFSMNATQMMILRQIAKGGRKEIETLIAEKIARREIRDGEGGHGTRTQIQGMAPCCCGRPLNTDDAADLRYGVCQFCRES